MNKEKIFEKMLDIMPYQLPKSIQPYVFEAMDIFAKELAMRFIVFQLGYTFHWGKARWENNLDYDGEYTHEELFNKFMFDCAEPARPTTKEQSIIANVSVTVCQSPQHQAMLIGLVDRCQDCGVVE